VPGRTLLFFGLWALGCVPEPSLGPFGRAEEEVWNAVNRNHRGRDRIYAQATLRTFAYEVAHGYARAEREGLGQEQLEYRLKQLVHSYVDGMYPARDGTDINSLFFQYLVYVNPSFNPQNPLQRKVFDNWRSEYVRRLIDAIYDPKFQVLRHYYDERWGPTLYSRLVFIVYLENGHATLKPPIADIGARTFLVDEQGNRYEPSGLAGPYPYDTDRPETGVLEEKAVYRVFFPNRRADRKLPIISPDSKYLELHIEGLGQEPVRVMRWDLPIEYPELLQRRLPSEAELAARKAAEGE
jgi:hypothetical protein